MLFIRLFVFIYAYNFAKLVFSENLKNEMKNEFRYIVALSIVLVLLLQQFQLHKHIINI